MCPGLFTFLFHHSHVPTGIGTTTHLGEGCIGASKQDPGYRVPANTFSLCHFIPRRTENPHYLQHILIGVYHCLLDAVKCLSYKVPPHHQVTADWSNITIRNRKTAHRAGAFHKYTWAHQLISQPNQVSPVSVPWERPQNKQTSFFKIDWPRGQHLFNALHFETSSFREVASETPPTQSFSPIWEQSAIPPCENHDPFSSCWATGLQDPLLKAYATVRERHHPRES